MEFESALLQMQMQIERTFLQVAASTGRPSVVVMDRGVLDIKAYMSAALWDRLLKRHGLTEEYIDKRYDLVLHLVSAAHGAEKYYTTANNRARKSTIEQARELDTKIVTAYDKQRANGKLARVDNSTDFSAKLERATAAVINMFENQ